MRSIRVKLPKSPQNNMKRYRQSSRQRNQRPKLMRPLSLRLIRNLRPNDAHRPGVAAAAPRGTNGTNR
jgi:hypothetical protein